MRLMKVALGVSLTAAAIGLAIAAPSALAGQPPSDDVAQPQIIGGGNASQTYSFMVSLQTSQGHHCGGSLIAPQWVATAAHCVGSLVQARVGTTTWNSGGTLVRIASQTKSPDGRDFALVKLASAVQQAPIAIAADPGPTGTVTRLIGWGQTCPTRGCGGAPTNLQEIDVKVLSSGCTDDFDPTKEICLGDKPNTGACYGDSGGPSVRQVNGRWELTGATSRAGQGQDTCGTAPAIYMNVPAYKNWINQTTGGGTTPTPTPTPTPSCSDVQPWNPNAWYSPGNRVSYTGHRWEATWYTSGQAPGSSPWSNWRDLGAC